MVKGHKPFSNRLFSISLSAVALSFKTLHLTLHFQLVGRGGSDDSLYLMAQECTGLKYVFIQEYKINTTISSGDSSGTADFLFAISSSAQKPLNISSLSSS